MKNGATTFTRNDGKTSASSTVAFGTKGPTRSIAAERLTT